MKNHYSLLLLLMCLSFFNGVAQVIHVNPTDISAGIIVKKVWLENYELPQVQITGKQYKSVASLPAKVTLDFSVPYKVAIGQDRKRPFALVYIPAYSKDANGFTQLSDFTLTVQEAAASKLSGQTAKLTGSVTASTSALAAGTWYKIAVPSTGLYKIDGNFLKKIGIDVSNLKSSDIRIMGYGGNMLSENNAYPKKDDLIENAIMVNDGGDGVFNLNDYLVFYALGPMAWIKDSTNQKFVHQINLYSDSGYYFLSVNTGQGLRVGTQASVPAANETVVNFNDYAVHEQDLYNPAALGKQWYGEQFTQNGDKTLSRNFSFNFGTAPDSIHCIFHFASVSTSDNNIFSVSLNNNILGSVNLGAVQSNAFDQFDPVPDQPLLWVDMPYNSASANFTINFQPGNSGTIGYLDNIEINMRRPLSVTDAQLGFRDWRSVGPGKIANYQLGGANANTQVWDVTNVANPVLMNGSFTGNTYGFSQDAQILHEFVAMNNSNLPLPAFGGLIPNQNLHGQDQTDFIIVANPLLIDAANQLADFHRQKGNLRVLVATTTEVYNEFSSGSQDISAIRDFAKMFYDRAGKDVTQMPKYLLLFGGASYDYKQRVANNSNLVPTYETAMSHDNINSYCSDDFFGFLDANEDINNSVIINALDIGVGRLPARNLNDADAMVAKIKNYKSTNAFGPWRIASTFVADIEDNAGYHLRDADAMAAQVKQTSNNIHNETKVYLDAIPLVSTPAGPRCPNANASINDNIYKGTFLLNYSGHGNTQVLSKERILTQDDYNSWVNPYALPIVITAACDFGQYDQPSFVSAGEQLVTRNNGGAIAALTTTQGTYAGENHQININFWQAQLSRYPDGHFNTLGDALRIGKNMTYAISTGNFDNYRKFVLLGDPALTPDIPYYNVINDSITDGTSLVKTDSVKALGSYQVHGRVLDLNGNLMNNFNGTISVSFYDKSQLITVSTYSGASSETFEYQTNIVYKGKATVTNGHFAYTFIAPKDINYNYGQGKISSYATNGITDAAGADTGISVGGYSDNPILSTTPPTVRPFIGDSLFIDGGITGSNTSLFVILTSQTGINVSGNDVGHDLVGILDGHFESPYLLNNYYETLPDSYQKGFVSFPVNGLSDGEHTITVRAWDVNDNFAEGTVHFVVADGQVVKIDKLMNYPNPFKDITHFVFEHNHPDELLNVQIEIYNISGSLVKVLNQSFTPTGSRTDEVIWDGRSDNGSPLQSGVYVYRMKLSTAKGISASAYQKLVLIR